MFGMFLLFAGLLFILDSLDEIGQFVDTLVNVLIKWSDR